MIFRSTEPNISIPQQPITEIVLQRSLELADKPAMIDGLTGRTITYRELADSISKVAAGFAARGFSKGDVVAIYSPNCLEYPIAFQAIASNGGVTTTANPYSDRNINLIAPSSPTLIWYSIGSGGI